MSTILNNFKNIKSYFNNTFEVELVGKLINTNLKTESVKILIFQTLGFRKNLDTKIFKKFIFEQRPNIIWVINPAAFIADIVDFICFRTNDPCMDHFYITKGLYRGRNLSYDPYGILFHDLSFSTNISRVPKRNTIYSVLNKNQIVAISPVDSNSYYSLYINLAYKYKLKKLDYIFGAYIITIDEPWKINRNIDNFKLRRELKQVCKGYPLGNFYKNDIIAVKHYNNDIINANHIPDFPFLGIKETRTQPDFEMVGNDKTVETKSGAYDNFNIKSKPFLEFFAKLRVTLFKRLILNELKELETLVSKVISLKKKPDIKSFKDIRPISILPTSFKLVENSSNTLKIELDKFIGKNIYSYRSGHSACELVVKLIGDMNSIIDDG